MIVLPLELVYADVVARFASDGTTASVVFGARELAKQINQGPGRANRVVFVPGVGDSPGGGRKLGAYGPPVRPGRNPRPLRTLLETAHVHVWAYDGAASNDELAQYRAAMLLHDAVIRAIELSARTAAHANVAVGYSAPEEVRSAVERTFGYELRFVLTLQHEIPDTAYSEADPANTIMTIGTFLDNPAPPGTNDGPEVIQAP